MSSKMVGVIGGVGPGATATFYWDVVRQYAARRGGNQPALVMYSVPMEAQIERAMLHEGVTAGPEVDRLLAMLEEGVQRLARAGVDAIAMPCNTLQAYLPEIVARAGLPYISLIAETVNALKCRGCEQVAVICTTPMRALGLYQAELAAQSVAYCLPTNAEQAEVTQAILETLHPSP
ncbi:MAG: aspartate/glutamate racemase family protein, partial [Anaerolineales bacterium]